jgi:hypothetical protein
MVADCEKNINKKTGIKEEGSFFIRKNQLEDLKIQF